MNQDILIACHGDHYRLLHGQLRLTWELNARASVRVDVREAGTVRIVKARGDLFVERGNRQLPLF